MSRPLKHVAIHDYVSKVMNYRWLTSIPITIYILHRQVMSHVLKNKNDTNYKELTKTYINSGYPIKKMQMFLNRSLEYCNFIKRKSSVSQKYPIN